MSTRRRGVKVYAADEENPPTVWVNRNIRRLSNESEGTPRRQALRGPIRQEGGPSRRMVQEAESGITAGQEQAQMEISARVGRGPSKKSEALVRRRASPKGFAIPKPVHTPRFSRVAATVEAEVNKVGQDKPR
ncbi:unnamed protein product [Linum trigynum]|uniref:Uncharacterized protein n=1 Tax=Linum trigynum TaxID=586398 RepID=A0AAV2FBU3_9ROSI